MRSERDALGEKQLPDEALYGIHTVRSLENFSAADEPFPLPIIHAVAVLKQACAQANAKLGNLDKDKARAIEEACQEIIVGKWDKQFPIDLFQAGSGTSSHMNVNEVIANLAAEKLGGRRGERKLVHPNDDVNRGQSSNDVIPSAIRISAYQASVDLLESLQTLIHELRKKGDEFKKIVKAGRTHLQDAVPMTLGQEFNAYAQALEKAQSRIEEARTRLLELPIGGNAIGTGINTPPTFRKEAITALQRLTKQDWRQARDGVEVISSLTDLAGFSSAMNLLSIDLQKMCNDLRLLASGPNTGFHEIILPAVEPGSSIMPGKVNPSICESSLMACMQVQGLDHAVSLAAGAGQLELNTHMPLVGANLLKMVGILTRTCEQLSSKCIVGMKADVEQCRKHFETSAALATVLNPKLGYDKVSSLVKESLQAGKTVKLLVIEKKLLTAEEFEDLVQDAVKQR